MSIAVIFIAANTVRSQAYAQAMKHNGIRVTVSLMYGDNKFRAGQLDAESDDFKRRKVLQPTHDIGIPLEESLEEISDSVIYVEAGHINSQKIVSELKNIEVSLIVYSGYGSQIVGKELLNIGVPILHIHSGWLPQFRGSTTLYYELLSKKKCSASALLLVENIDEGPVVSRKNYAAPSTRADIDYVYDPLIRSDLLCYVLRTYFKNKKLPIAISQDKNEAQTYYVIHPVLKHLAILMID